MNTKTKMYTGLVILGLTLVGLEYWVAQNKHNSYNFLLVLVYLISVIYLVDEIVYYRSFHASLASSQFVIIPGLLILITNVLGPVSAGVVAIDLQMNAFDIRSKTISYMMILPIIFFTLQIRKFYTGKYVGIAIRRKIFLSPKIPISIHIILVISLIYTSVIFGYMDFFTLVFLIISLGIAINQLLSFQSVRSQDRYDSNRRRYMQGLLSQPPQISQRNTIDRSSENTPNRNRGQIPTRSRRGERVIATRSRRTTEIQVPRTQSKKAAKKNRRSLRNKLSNKQSLPTGHVIRDDLKCMICYQEFVKSSKTLVAICPFCKYPSHDGELVQWLQTSNLCPRCNKILGNGSAGKINKISETDYVKLRDSIK